MLVALTTVVMNSFGRLVLSHLKDITDCMLDSLHYAYWANRSAVDTANVGLNDILQQGFSTRILFVDFSLGSTPPSLKSSTRCSLNSLRPPPPVSGSAASWLTGGSRGGWGASYPALVPPRGVSSLHCSSPSIPMTVPQEILLWKSLSMRMTLLSLDHLVYLHHCLDQSPNRKGGDCKEQQVLRRK